MDNPSQINSDRSTDLLQRPPVHFGPPSIGMSPEESLPIIEGREIPSNIYRPEQQTTESNTQETI
jgi:hypothetical protein